MNAALLTTIIMAVSAVGVPAVGGWYAYRASRRNAEASHDIEQDKLTAESWGRQLQAWREDVVLLRQQRAEDAKEYAAQHKEYTAQHKECVRQIDDLTVQVRKLQRQHDTDEERHRAEQRAMTTQLASMIAWARTVVGLLTAAGIAFPKPPPGVQDTNPNIPRLT